jgi:murein DD-endopeptidase MepM/ murein hydrolase activator NlpD
MILLCLTPMVVEAQTTEPDPAPATPAPGSNEDAAPIPQVHVVQEGENLTFIAQSYGVSVEELRAINNLSEGDLLYAGDSLIIPGGEGEAVATVYTVQAGDTLAGIAATFNTTSEKIAETNHLINPQYDLTVGQTISVVSRTGSALPQPVMGTPHLVAPGESISMIAARYQVSPAALAAANDLSFPTYLYAGQRLRIPGQEEYRHLPGAWVDVAVRPLPIEPGTTVSIYVENLLDGRPTGQFAGQSLRFVPHDEGFVALVGLDAFTEPGVYPLQLSGSGDRPWPPFRQDLQIEPGNYGTQSITIPEELTHLLDPQIRQDENAFLATIYTQFTEEQQWQGLFQQPVTTTVVTAPYGDGRSYNDGPVEIFHSGVDFAGAVGTPILAPANGAVVFNDELELRGNAVIIDHGLGVMSAYFHLSESYVTVGEVVSAGQTIAAGGTTGLSNGPHLHWDLRIMNVPVNGLQWTREVFP